MKNSVLDRLKNYFNEYFSNATKPTARNWKRICCATWHFRRKYPQWTEWTIHVRAHLMIRREGASLQNRMPLWTRCPEASGGFGGTPTSIFAKQKLQVLYTCPACRLCDPPELRNSGDCVFLITFVKLWTWQKDDVVLYFKHQHDVIH